MKKSLVLAMAMALGVTASAYAANPFSDVPAGHWAYDSIDKLAAAGVIDGMGDGTFQGGRNMTRYEMAQIVAKAMAKGANVDKLAAEFAEELDNLGVRVAALEKKADNVTITGGVYYTYAHRHDAARATGKSTVEKNRLRTRLFLKGAINEDWTFNGRLQNDETVDNGVADNTIVLNRVWVDGRVGGLKVKAGKFQHVIADGNFNNDTLEGVKVSYGKNVVVSGFVGNNDTNGYSDDIYGVSLATKVGKLGLTAEWTKLTPENKSKGAKAAEGIYGKENQVWDIVAKYQFNKNVGVNYTYLNSKMEGSTTSNGHVAGITYKGAKAAQPGSWGMFAKYVNQSKGTLLGTVTVLDAATDLWEVAGEKGVQGYVVGFDYALAKNIVFNMNYNNLETKRDNKSLNMIWNNIAFTF